MKQAMRKAMNLGMGTRWFHKTDRMALEKYPANSVILPKSLDLVLTRLCICPILPSPHREGRIIQTERGNERRNRVWEKSG